MPKIDNDVRVQVVDLGTRRCLQNWRGKQELQIVAKKATLEHVAHDHTGTSPPASQVQKFVCHTVYRVLQGGFTHLYERATIKRESLLLLLCTFGGHMAPILMSSSALRLDASSFKSREIFLPC